MAKTLAMIKAHSASVKRRASMYSEIADTAGSNVSGISSLKIAHQRQENTCKKLE